MGASSSHLSDSCLGGGGGDGDGAGGGGAAPPAAPAAPAAPAKPQAPPPASTTPKVNSAFALAEKASRGWPGHPARRAASAAPTCRPDMSAANPEGESPG